MIDLVALLGLALLDSMSVGTLIIPLALVLSRRRVDFGPLAAYLGTVVGIYFALGVALLTGYDVLAGPLTRAWSSEVGVWTRLVIGAVLLLVGVLWRTPRVASVTVPRPRSLSLGAMVALGAGAALTEAATMLPYVAANALIAAMPLGWPLRLLVLAGYCLVMILPACVLLPVTAVVGDRVWPRLERFLPWLARQAKISLLWAAAVVGVVLVRGAWLAMVSSG